MSSSNFSRQHHRYSNSNRRDSPTSSRTSAAASSSSSSAASSRPRSSSKTSSSTESNQRSKASTPNSNCNGNKNMPSVSTSPAANADHQLADGLANLNLDNIRIGCKLTAQMTNGSVNRGEVIAYDPNFKMLILKCSGSRSGVNNVAMLNLARCSDIKLDEEAKDVVVTELQALDTGKLQRRLKESVEKKQKAIMAYKAGVTPEGHSLFLTICKTMDEVTWDDKRISVMKEVFVEPPYRAENVRGEGKAYNHVRKIVEKHMMDQGIPIQPSTESLDSSASTTCPTASAASNVNTNANVHSPTIPNLPQASAPPNVSSSSNKPSASGRGRGGGGGGGGPDRRSNHRRDDGGGPPGKNLYNS